MDPTLPIQGRLVCSGQSPFNNDLSETKCIPPVRRGAESWERLPGRLGFQKDEKARDKKNEINTDKEKVDPEIPNKRKSKEGEKNAWSRGGGSLLSWGKGAKKKWPKPFRRRTSQEPRLIADFTTNWSTTFQGKKGNKRRRNRSNYGRTEKILECSGRW